MQRRQRKFCWLTETRSVDIGMEAMLASNGLIGDQNCIRDVLGTIAIQDSGINVTNDRVRPARIPIFEKCR
jgi:hypothetical protein